MGLDVGTTSTQMIVSSLAVQNQAGSFSVPQMQITDRKIVYRSKVHFTPLLDENRVDAQALKEIVAREYEAAGLQRHQVDTGAVIITGETSRKENAREVLAALSDFAGDFVVATAGPDLESVLAAKGAGAVRFSEETGKTVLHMDIGGGTANLALIREGHIVETGCLNVGGRLIKFDEQGKIQYISPVLRGICSFSLGEKPGKEQVAQVAQLFVSALEMAAGFRESTELLQRLTTQGTAMKIPNEPVVLSFSGGVADCIETSHPWLAFGDMGPVLGEKIRESRLCEGEYRLGQETIRATVIGAGCHSTQLSGSTVFHRSISFPLKNLQVLCLPERAPDMSAEELAETIRGKKKQLDGLGILFIPGHREMNYMKIRHLAQNLVQAQQGQTVLLAVQQDMAKALGQAMALYLPESAGCLCIDGLSLEEGNYLDVGAPVGPAMPVVIKTLIFTG